MPRSSRLDAPGVLHHVMGRGIERRKIFIDRQARQDFITVHEISQAELRSGSRRHDVVEARRVLSWLAVKELGYSGADVARHLGVTNSCVIRLASAGKAPLKKTYL